MEFNFTKLCKKLLIFFLFKIKKKKWQSYFSNLNKSKIKIFFIIKLIFLF
jgi:hypothetical protein